MKACVAIVAGALAGFASQSWAEDVCRKFVPSAGITVAVPCNPEADPIAVTTDTMERREGHELHGDSYRVLQLADLAACEQACLADPKCVAVEFYRQKSACGLFDALPAVKRAKLIDVAIRKRAPAAALGDQQVQGQALAAAQAGGAAERPKWCSEQPAFNAAEKLVCSEAELSALDLELEGVFSAAVAAKPAKAERAKLQAAEDRWAETRDQCQANRVCVKAAYQLRIEQLRQQIPVARKP